MQHHTTLFRLSMMCRVLDVSRSGYYAWLRRPDSVREVEEVQLAALIKEEFDTNKKRYGSPRITAAIRDRGWHCNHKRIARIMREKGLYAQRKKKFKHTTDSNHTYSIAQNVVDRQFASEAPNQLWLSDVTYIWTGEGWLYLAVVLDMCSRLVVGFAMQSRLKSVLAQTALRNAVGRRHPKPGLIHHSDRGGEYAATEYQNLLKEYEMIPSMSRKGNCWDNAPMESFYATLKKELIYREQFKTRAEAEQKIFEYIEVYYNNKRRHSKLGYLSPMEYERRMYHQPTNLSS